MLGKHCVKRPTVTENRAVCAQVEVLKDLSGGMYLCGLFSGTGGVEEGLQKVPSPYILCL